VVWDRVRRWITDENGFRNLSRATFGFFQGRHTFFAIFFTGSGFYLALTGRLTDSYVHLITALQTLIFAHSAKEAIEEHFKDSN